MSAIFLFVLLWPPFSIFLFFCLNKRHYVTYFLFLFCALWFGYTFPFSNKELDSWHYAQFLIDLQIDKFFEYYIVGAYQSPDRLDFFIPIITYIVRLLGGNENFLFMIFSYIYFQTQYLIYRQLPKSELLTARFAVFFLFYSIAPIMFINGFRFYFACWFLAFCIVLFVLKNNRLALVLLLFAPMIHYSMFGIVALLILIFALMKHFFDNRIFIFPLSIFLSCGLLGLYSLEIVDLLSSFISIDGIDHKVRAYTSEEYLSQLKSIHESQNIFKQLRNAVVNPIFILSVFFTSIHYKKLLFIDYTVYKLWMVTISTGGFSLFFYSVSSMARFQSVFLIFSMIFFLFLMDRDKYFFKHLKFKVLSALVFVAFILQFIVVFRDILDMIGTNFFVPIFLEPYIENVSIMMFLKELK